GRRGVDGDGQPVEREGEIVRPGVAPRHPELQARRVRPQDRAGIGGAQHEAPAEAVEPDDRAAVREAGQIGGGQQRGMQRRHVATEGGVARDDVPQNRVDDLDLTRGTERRTMAGRGHPLHSGRCQQHPADPRRAPCPHGESAVFANASGRRSRSTQRRSVRGPTAITSRSSPNSASSWRQAPQGDAGGSTSVATTMRRNPRAPAPPPSATAAPIAMRSAQIVSPYDALSTFVPTYTPPSAASRAAPTRNLL